MTNHEPNDLSHLSEAEFNALCPQGEHAPGPEPLSPAAQTILDAYGRETGDIDCVWHSSELKGLAAALRAAADQCKIEWHYHPDYPETESVITVSDLLAIADELEDQP
jgi:hypothetical protein